MGAFPSLAQEGKLIKAGVEKGIVLAEQVGREAAKAQLASPKMFALNFVNMPATVTALSVQTQLMLHPKELTALQLSPENNTVQAEFFPTKHLDRRMPEFDDLELYGVMGFRSQGPSVYRGVVLKDLQELENLLICGMEIDKTGYDGIFTSRYLSVALDYAHRQYGNIPTLVQVPVTDFLLTRRMRGDMMEDVFNMDIPAYMISNVMVFVKINGKPGWYDVKLQEDKLIFSKTALWPEDMQQDVPEDIPPTE